ncbi:hypothetical protein [Streptomyces sp. NPDC005244]|uniref:hypothetical protein n=1 Tax=Streptomyces sp. NPDC005244 TaxID=3364708 RepID=UPI0036821A89
MTTDNVAVIDNVPTPDVHNNGAGIFNGGTLVMKDRARVSGNKATGNAEKDLGGRTEYMGGDGGGIYNQGTVTL